MRCKHKETREYKRRMRFDVLDGSMQRQPSRQPKQVLQRGVAVHSSEAPRWLQWLPSPPQHSAAPERHPTGRWWDEIFQHRCCPRTWAKLSETVPGCAWIAGKVAEWLARMLIKITRKTFSAAFLMETKQNWNSTNHEDPWSMLTRKSLRQVAWWDIPSSALHIVSQDHASPFSRFWTGTSRLAVPDGLTIFKQCGATRPTDAHGVNVPFQLTRFPTTAKQFWRICIRQHLDPAIFVKLPCTCRKRPPKVSHAVSSFLSVSLWIEAGDCMDAASNQLELMYHFRLLRRPTC